MTKEEILKTAKPILFNTAMIGAIQKGRKTVTRRLIKPKFTNTKIIIKDGRAFETVGTPTLVEINPAYKVGDVLYVRETFALYDCEPNCPAKTHDSFPPCNTEVTNTRFYIYKADGCVQSPCGVWCVLDKWTPSIHMPKEAARIFLSVTGVRAEQLQDITEEQAIAEGIRIGMGGEPYFSCRDAYIPLWNSTVEKADLDRYGWTANPCVWVYEFKKIVVK